MPCTSVGSQSLISNNQVMANTAVGFQSLISDVSGSYNTAVGFKSLYSNTAGQYNTVIGYNAGLNIINGSNNIYLGASADSSGSTDTSGSLVLGSINVFTGAVPGTNTCYLPITINGVIYNIPLYQ
jgi:hypothetical protein